MIGALRSLGRPWWMAVALIAASAAGLFAGRLVARSSDEAGIAPRSAESTSGGEVNSASRAFPVQVSVPTGPPRVSTGEIDALGREVSVSCASCHANLEPNLWRNRADEPALSFHQGLLFDHGSLSCVSCHNPQNYNTLRLADGVAIPYADFMTMCAQCHAPQARDWEHGAHGGMLGHWDLRRGPRFRKGCIDCHDPHAPQMPTMTPTFKPIDRFLPVRAPHGDDLHE